MLTRSQIWAILFSSAMRSIPTCFLFVVLTLSVCGCFGSRKRGEEDDSGFDGTDVVDSARASLGGADGGYAAAGGGVVGRLDAGIIDNDSEIDDPPCSRSCPELEWVEIPGGTFMMGAPGELEPTVKEPPHEVTIRRFKILKTEVTVDQYKPCVYAGACTEPKHDHDSYNWGKPGREKHPVNGVDWHQAREFGIWVGARLPSEAEWEYTARSGGQNIEYPWGDEEPTCEYSANASCNSDKTVEVCSKPLGNTAQGLCDMGGNVSEWVEDEWHDSYDNAPSDGSPWIDRPNANKRVIRGCDVITYAEGCRCWMRSTEPVGYIENGFRIAQDSELYE